MAIRCGIDLGTTYSSISWFDDFNNLVDTIDLNTADGSKMIRSVVYYPLGGGTVVGDTAWNAARTKANADRVIVGIKRSMGMGFKTAPIDGKEYTPEEVSAEILRVLIQDAEAYLGEEVKDVVITVPAYFGDTERAATEKAGQLAGLNVLGILPEPHAAALAFAVDKIAEIVDKHLLVYDLGGGTFDVTLIHATTSENTKDAINLKIETLCKDGNAALGGLDWDRALAEIVAEKVEQQHNVDIREDSGNEPILMDACEKSKRHLTRINTVSIVADSANHQVEVTRGEFEDRTRDLLLQTELLLVNVIEDAGKNHGVEKDRIEVMLSGGSSRMPMVETMVQSITSKAPLKHRNPDLLVTIGAAYWAHILTSDKPISVPVPGPGGTVDTKEVTIPKGGLSDVSVYAVGVEVLRPDGRGGTARSNSVVVPAGATYGEDHRKEFRTSENNMTEILIVLYRGDSPEIDECEPLATFTITGLPQNLPKNTRVDVTLGYDHSGILRGEAVVETGEKVQIIVDRESSRHPSL